MARRPDPAPAAFDMGELAGRYRLSDPGVQQLDALLHLLSTDPGAPTALRDAQRVLEDHLADSLVALELHCVRVAASAVDIGSGAGLPGLPLAIAVPSCSFVLLESSARKCTFLARAVDACRLSNVEVVHSRAETWEAGRGQFDLALARAVSRLDSVLEYAAPLLRVGGEFIAWRGQREPEAEVEAEKAAKLLQMAPKGIRPVSPYPGTQHRHLHLFSKVRATPPDFPRRPGMATKRPLGRSATDTAG